MAGLVCRPGHRPAVDDHDRAGLGLLRIGATADGASVLLDPVPCFLGGLPHLCRRPHAVVGSAPDFRHGTRPYHKRPQYYRTIVPFCPADFRTLRPTPSQPVKLTRPTRIYAASSLVALPLSLAPFALDAAAGFSR